MGKKKKAAVLDELHLILPSHPEFESGATPIVDTHTHLLSTYAKYRGIYTSPKFEDIFSFVRGLYGARVDHGSDADAPIHRTDAIIDVWCEAPVMKDWKEIADSALNEADRKDKWGGINYWFVMGVHPLHAEDFTDDVEREIIVAMDHPRCVGWGEIGLDYHYKDAASHEVQQAVFTRQLRHAVRMKKPLTIHTREAEEDTERILKTEVPKDHPIHIHCFTDTPEFALRLIEHFPNLYIGITGVITYTTNLNTPNLIRAIVRSADPLRILLETDAPYMTPANMYRDLPALPSNARLPLCHTGMVPWTAEFVAKVAEGVTVEQDAIEGAGKGWNMERVMHEARENARKVYGV